MKLFKNILGLAFGGVMAFCSLPCFNAMDGVPSSSEDIPITFSDSYPDWYNQQFARPGQKLCGGVFCQGNEYLYSRYRDFYDAGYGSFMAKIRKQLPGVTKIYVGVFFPWMETWPNMEKIGNEQEGWVYGTVSGSTLYLYDATLEIYPLGAWGRDFIGNLKELIDKLGQHVK